jgi:hypothetical protein
MKKLVLLVALAFALLASVTAGQVSTVVSAVPGVGDALAAKVAPIVGTNVVCASIGVEDAGACGGEVYQWVAIDSSPPGGSYIGWRLGPCSASEAGQISFTWNWAVRYTVQCQKV